MSRCTACNKPFNAHESLARNPITKEPEDLCRRCINSYRVPDELYEDREDKAEIWFVLNKLDNKPKSW